MFSKRINPGPAGQGLTVIFIRTFLIHFLSKMDLLNYLIGIIVLLVTVKVAPHECIIRTGLP